MSDVEAHYQRVAGAWRLLMGDDLHLGFFTGRDAPLETATRALTDELARFGHLQPGERVLDVGCGLGAPAVRLQRRWGCQVTGVTLSQAELELARQHAGGDGPRFFRADFMGAPPTQESFDLVWMLESSHLFRSKAALFGRAARALDGKGRVVACDIILRRPLGLAGKIGYALSSRTVNPSRLLSLRRAFGKGSLSSLAGLAGALDAAGFRSVDTRDISAAVIPTMARWRENLRQHRPEVERLLGARGAEDFAMACDLLEDLMRRGILGYGMIKAVL